MRTTLPSGEQAQVEARGFIAERYGQSFLPKEARFTRQSARRQEAHEAIRPTRLRQPVAIKDYLSLTSSGCIS